MGSMMISVSGDHREREVITSGTWEQGCNILDRRLDHHYIPPRTGPVITGKTHQQQGISVNLQTPHWFQPLLFCLSEILSKILICLLVFAIALLIMGLGNRRTQLIPFDGRSP